MSAVLKEKPPLVPGIYEGLPMADYLAMPAASASTMITLLERCPRAAWFDSWLNPRNPSERSTPAQSVGTLAHELLLEGTTAQLQIIDPCDYPAEKTGNIPEGWTNKAIKAARDQALAAGRIPVFPAVAAAVESMVVEARSYLASIANDEPAIHDMFQPGGGRSEVTIVWEEDGCLFRMRPDRIAAAMNLMGDVKTTKTTAEPDRWGRTQLFGMNYYVAAAFYRRGLERATDKKADYVYLVQEQAEPFMCSLAGLNPMAQQIGARKAERAIATWKDCVKNGRWPGYPTRVAYPEPPGWEVASEHVEESVAHAYDYPDMGWKKPAPKELLGFDRENEPL